MTRSIARPLCDSWATCSGCYWRWRTCDDSCWKKLSKSDIDIKIPSPGSRLSH